MPKKFSIRKTVLNKSPIIIIGHQNPDTDAIVSTIVYCQIKAKLGFNVKSARVGQISQEARFVLSYFKQNIPPLIKNVKGKRVILLDHGDSSQSAPGVKEAEVVEVIDHHYIGDITTEKPIFYRAEPIGSTSSIIFKLCQEKKINLTKTQAGLLLAGVISDTLYLHSPTTTSEDKKILKQLAQIAKIKPKELAEKMFEVKSEINNANLRQIIEADYKKYKFGSVKFGIGVFETVKPEKIRPLQARLFNQLKQFKAEKKLPLYFFLVVDILKQNSFLYLIGREEEKIAQKVFKSKITNRKIFLPGVVSRKKQVLPAIAKLCRQST